MIATELRMAWIVFNGMGATGDGKVVFNLMGQRLLAGIETQWQHPEHEGVVRTIWWPNGVKLCASFESWGNIKEAVRHMLMAEELLGGIK